MYAHGTTEYSEMDDFWLLAGEDFFRSLVLEYSMWSTVLYVEYGSVHTLLF